MLEWRSMALAVVLCGSCRVTPDGDHLDRSGHYHEEVVDEGSYAIYQHQGASWEKVGYVWVGPEAEHSVWVLRRPGVGGYPYRPPSADEKELWTRFKRISREDACVEDLIAGEHIDPARYYSIDSHQLVGDLPAVVVTPPPALEAQSESAATTPSAAITTDGAYRLMRDGEDIGYLWVSGEKEVFLLHHDAAMAIEASACTGKGEPHPLVPVRIGDAGSCWGELIGGEDDSSGEYEVFTCHCREHKGGSVD
jgi:hypothetical protein